MKHARLETPEGSRIVRADGTVPRPWDTEHPVLHLLPQLFLGADALAACPSPPVSCTVAVLAPPGLAMSEALVVRQPFPNRRYLVAGTDDSRYGLLVPLPAALPDEVVVRCSWRFTDPAQADAVRGWGGEDASSVDHLLRLRLRPTDRGQVFSTDINAWPRTGVRSLPSCDRMPCAVLSPRELSRDRQDATVQGWNFAGDEFAIEEVLELPGILLSDIWGFEEFSEEQLHEVAHTAAFDPASPTSCAHRANACVEMPPEVLVEAVTLARGVPYGSGTAYAGSMAACERHPALLSLCGWWNANAPDPKHQRAGLCLPWVRVRDDGNYWCAHDETPTMPVDRSVKRPAMAARIGDVVLVEFAQGQGAATFGSGLELWDVAGDPWYSVGVDEGEVRSGECDEGRHALRSLAGFPERFPVAWAWLRASTGRAAARGNRATRLARLCSKLRSGVPGRRRSPRRSPCS